MVGAYPIFIKYGSKGSQKSYLSVNKEAWGLTKFKKNKNEKASSKPHPTCKYNQKIYSSQQEDGFEKIFFIINVPIAKLSSCWKYHKKLSYVYYFLDSFGHQTS